MRTKQRTVQNDRQIIYDLLADFFPARPDIHQALTRQLMETIRPYRTLARYLDAVNAWEITVRFLDTDLHLIIDKDCAELRDQTGTLMLRKRFAR